MSNTAKRIAELEAVLIELYERAPDESDMGDALQAACAEHCRGYQYDHATAEFRKAEA